MANAVNLKQGIYLTMISIPISLHHFEVCVNDLSFVNLLVNGYGFEEWLERKNSFCRQYVLRSRHCVFIVTNRLSADCDGTSSVDSYPSLFCCGGLKHENDSVFNVALEVPDIENSIQLIRTHGGKILREPYVIEDEYGFMKYAVIAPPCENLIHTLIEKQNYTGFLPGFYSVQKKDVLPSSIRMKSPNMEYIDHVTYVTEPGHSTKLIQWYEEVFKMKRIFTNREDTLADGFVLRDSIGLRLKALQYWRCAETGATTPGSDSPDQLKIVIAEPLPDVEESHVQAFLKSNGGPGVQHIALSTNSIFECVEKITNAGVKFRMPPYTYYEDIIERIEFRDSGIEKNFEKLEKLGILIDFEEGHESAKYLMQIFSYPVFKKDTFFLEVIQRNGASGFGSGNIAALARSIIRFQQEKTNKVLIEK